jgi:hypothetical protein
LWAVKIDPVVGEPLHRMRRADRTEALLDAVDHHVTDHLAADAGGCRHPGDRLMIMAVEGEGDAHDLAIPAGELQRIRAPAAVRAGHRDRLDTELLKRGFLGWLRGERGYCSMARVPTIAEEDAKRPNRERESLVGERTRIVNRIKATLARLGIRNFKTR